MTDTPLSSNFFSQMAVEFGNLRQTALGYVAPAACLSFITDLSYWNNGTEYSILDYGLEAIYPLVWFGCAYFISMKLIGKPSSVMGLLIFLLVAIVTLLPVVAFFALIHFADRSELENGATILMIVMLLFIGLLFVAWLPAWPVAQSISSRIINPLRIFRATKGYRWSLIGMSLALGSMNKVVPGIAPTADVGKAIAFALFGAFVASLMLAWTVSISVTAWRFSVRNDPDLG
jgi:hypothetical protein